MNRINPLQPVPCKLLHVLRHTNTEWTFRVASDADPQYGQFCMLSLPKIGEAPISVSGKGPGYMEFTIRNTGNLTKEIFRLQPGDNLFIRGLYGNHWPVEEEFEGKHLLVVCGGTAFAPVLMMLNHFYDHPELVKSIHLIVGFKNTQAVLFAEEIRKFRTKFDTCIATLDTGADGEYEGGMVTAHIGKIPIADWGDDYNIVVVGPPVMMHFATLECNKFGAADEKMWVSFERKMSCGIGKCGHCKINGTYVCLEGPVFNYAATQGQLID